MDKPFDRFGPSTCIPDDRPLQVVLAVQFNPLAHPLWTGPLGIPELSEKFQSQKIIFKNLAHAYAYEAENWRFLFRKRWRKFFIIQPFGFFENQI